MLTDKGKGKALVQDEPEEHFDDSASGTDSDSDSTSSSPFSNTSDSDSDLDDISPEYLESLLQKARQNIASKANLASLSANHPTEEEVITLPDDGFAPLPPLDPGTLPKSYFDGTKVVCDPDVELAEKAMSSRAVPDEPARPPELARDGKVLTKKEQKELKKKAKGPGYFDLPTHAPEELPRLYREVEALRLRNQLDPKRFYRKEEGEGKGIKGLPKQFAIGTILPTKTPFGTQSRDNLPKAARKRTIVDELVDDAEAKSYAKKKFRELQTVRGARGRNTLRKKNERRKAKW
ncbi:Fcf2-domain-containing protein [Neolentinus lepideus HHB14362 ss-1]|uniref:Fcf2-domain-containing protein n=1 Tax=Neolentinus lepideus HHB14362 ss-1 TaxID=1314782 RepID=A0A165TZS1_9AGAM|nr:Fcf2-domain-containing protein [Neolentinus lepideus HHB14362 ss-1]